MLNSPAMTTPLFSREYWRAARQPRYSLLFALPLLLLYELLAFALSGSVVNGVRNGADVLLKSVFVVAGGRRGVLIFDLLLLAVGLTLVWRDYRRSGRVLKGRVFLGMVAEAVVYALMFGSIAALLTTVLLSGGTHLAIQAGAAPATAMSRLSLPTQIMVSLGAGLYEELLFRVLLVSGLAALGRRLGWNRLASGVFATVVGALIFSAFHYIGPYGDPWALGSFVFRAVAGVLFSALYLLRGFGVTAWTHALYDIFLAI